MGRVGTLRYIEFRLADANEAPITGKHLSDMTVFFVRNDVACTDMLTMAELPAASGRYVVTYNPTAPGHDYLELYNAQTDERIIDSDDIDTVATFFGLTATVDVTQDTAGVGALKAPSYLADKQTFTLLIFNTSDWITGKTDPNYAIAGSQLDVQGNWITTPLTLIHGTYTFVLSNGVGTTLVIAPKVTI